MTIEKFTNGEMFTCTSKQADDEALENLAKISPTRIKVGLQFIPLQNKLEQICLRNVCVLRCRI